MNGKPGDHPVTDICVHGYAVFSPKADELVRELMRLGGPQAVYGLLDDWFSPPSVPDLERQLEAACNQLREKK
jgi:hypothetical protein